MVDHLDNRRTSSNCWIGHTQDSITLSTVKRISELVQIPSSHAEAFQVLHYSNSQEYQPHLDTFDTEDEGYQSYLKNGGQRIVTALAYLNNVEKEGKWGEMTTLIDDELLNTVAVVAETPEAVADEIKKRYSDQGDRITPAFYSGEEGLASRVISALRS